MFEEVKHICCYAQSALGTTNEALARIATIELFKKDPKYDNTKKYIILWAYGTTDVYELTNRSH